MSKPVIIDDIEQGTPEWLALRLGVASTSNFDRIITPATGKKSTQAEAYRRGLIYERRTGLPASSGYQSAAMILGKEMEAEARKEYEFISGESVRQVGFVFLDEGRRIGASPDGLIGEDGGLEKKCPLPHTHIGYLLSGKPEVSKYTAQIQGSLWITGRKWWDFFCYCPGEKPILTRIYRDEGYIDRMSIYLRDFIQQMDEEIEFLKSA